MGKNYLTCSKCGYVQAVGGQKKIWGCAKCKMQQAVALSVRRAENERGRRIMACADCGYEQSVRMEAAEAGVWMCYACRRPQLVGGAEGADSEGDGYGGSDGGSSSSSSSNGSVRRGRSETNGRRATNKKTNRGGKKR